MSNNQIERNQGEAPREGGGRRIFGMHPNVIVLGVVSFLTDVSSEMIYPIIPVFLTAVLGARELMVGVIESVAESTASILKLVSGVISDKLQKRRFLIFIGYGLSAITKPVFAIAGSAWHVLFLRFSDRVGKGLRTSPRDAIIAESVDARTRGRAFGLHRAMDSAGAVIGPLLAYLIWRAIGTHDGASPFKFIFLISFIPAVLAVAAIAFAREKKVAPAAPKPEDRQKVSAIKLWKLPQLIEPFSREFKLFLIAVAIFQLGNSSDMFLLLRANRLMAPAVTAGGKELFLINENLLLMWCLFNVVYTAVSLVAGPHSDKIGRRRVALTGFVIYGAVYLGFGLATKASHAWILMLSYGVYYGLTEGVLRAYVADLCPADLRGTAYGLYHAVVGFLTLPASILFGAIWQFIGALPAFGMGAGLAVVAAVILLLFVPEHVGGKARL